MNKVCSSITPDDDHVSESNPSLLTAGVPSGSKRISQVMVPSQTIKPLQHHSINQNRATTSDHHHQTSQHSITSHRTISDTYLALSRKDIDDVINALHTLVQCAQDEYFCLNTFDDLSSPENSPRCSMRRKRLSPSIDRYFHRQSAEMKHKDRYRLFHPLTKQENRWISPDPSSHASYSSNAMLYSSTCGSRERSKDIHRYSRQDRPSTRNFFFQDRYHQSIKKNLSSYILDKLIYFHQNQDISNMKVLPHQAETLQILQNKPLDSLMSTDSLNSKDRHVAVTMANRFQHSNQIDAATQWSLQPLTLKQTQSSDTLIEMNQIKVPPTTPNSTILTNLSNSASTIRTSQSTMPPLSSSLKTPLPSLMHLSCAQSHLEEKQPMCDKPSETTLVHPCEMTKSETERFLTTLDLPTCRCSTINLAVEKSVTEDNIICLSLDNDVTMKKKRSHRTGNKSISARTRRPTGKTGKGHRTSKVTRVRPTGRRKIVRQEDSSVDLFDMDTTFFDSYDRLFTDTATISD